MIYFILTLNFSVTLIALITFARYVYNIYLKSLDRELSTNNHIKELHSLFTLQGENVYKALSEMQQIQQEQIQKNQENVQKAKEVLQKMATNDNTSKEPEKRKSRGRKGQKLTPEHREKIAEKLKNYHAKKNPQLLTEGSNDKIVLNVVG